MEHEPGGAGAGRDGPHTSQSGVGFELCGFLQTYHPFVDFALFQQRFAHLVIRIAIRRIEPDRRAKLPDRIIGLIHRSKCQAEVVLRFRVPRIGFDLAAELGRSLGELSPPQQREAKVVVPFGHRLIQFQSPGEF